MPRAVVPAAVGLGAFLFASAPRTWPEDWDGVGFVHSVARFDMARFAPHPPGYPVWVAAAKLARAIAPSSMVAATSVSILSGVLVGIFSGLALRCLYVARGHVAPWLGATAALITPLAWRSATVVGTEGLALACAAAAGWGLSLQNARMRDGAIVVGIAAGLGLGVRLSWAPIFVGVVVLAAMRGVRGARGWGALAFVAALAAWAVPLLVLVGPRTLALLYRAHLGGHATRWGGTALTDPHRAASLARDVVVDGFGGGEDLLGLCLGVLLAVASGRALLVWRRRGFPGVGYAVVVLAYLAWIAVGQNLREEPRHVVPVVVAVAVAIACALAATRAWTLFACAWLALLGLRTSSDALARRSIPPASASLVLFTRASSHASPGAMAFGARSARFFELDPEDARRGRPAATLGDVLVGMGRVDPRPARILVTDELEGLDRSPYPLVEVAHPCRPARLDRRRACLTIFELQVPRSR
jgi:hypothetical protein